MFEVIFCDPSEVNRPVKKSNCGIYERNKNLKTAQTHGPPPKAKVNIGKPPVFKKLLGNKDNNNNKNNDSVIKNGMINFKALTPVRQFNRSTGNLHMLQQLDALNNS